jgi:hypothetical protein
MTIQFTSIARDLETRNQADERARQERIALRLMLLAKWSKLADELALAERGGL